MPTPASPDTNNFRCNACGRFFNTATELRTHEQECRPAKMTTEQGRQELEREDAAPHPKNDEGSRERQGVNP